MSAALVPGRMRREAVGSSASLGALAATGSGSCEEGVGEGEAGPVWSSAMGGGEGRRGEAEGERAPLILVVLKSEDGEERGQSRRWDRVGGSTLARAKSGRGPSSMRLSWQARDM